MMNAGICFRYGLNKYCDSEKSIFTFTHLSIRICGSTFSCDNTMTRLSRYELPVDNESKQWQFELRRCEREQQVPFRLSDLFCKHTFYLHKLFYVMDTSLIHVRYDE